MLVQIQYAYRDLMIKARSFSMILISGRKWWLQSTSASLIANKCIRASHIIGLMVPISGFFLATFVVMIIALKGTSTVSSVCIEHFAVKTSVPCSLLFPLLFSWILFRILKRTDVMSPSILVPSFFSFRCMV